MTGTQQSQKTIYCSLVFIVNFVLLSCFHFNGVFRHIVGLQLVQRYITLLRFKLRFDVCFSSFRNLSWKSGGLFPTTIFFNQLLQYASLFFSAHLKGRSSMLKERLKERKCFMGRVVVHFLCVFIINNNGSSCPLEQTTWFRFFSSSFFVHDF